MLFLEAFPQPEPELLLAQPEGKGRDIRVTRGTPLVREAFPQLETESEVLPAKQEADLWRNSHKQNRTLEELPQPEADIRGIPTTRGEVRGSCSHNQHRSRD